MTTERDIRNQIRYAEKKGMKKGMAEGVEKVAREMRKDNIPIEMIVKYTGLSEEQVRAL